MGGSDREDEIRRWAEKLFYPVSLKGKVPKKDTTSRKIGSSAAKALSGHARIRAQIARTTRRSPEVMVKITNRLGAGKGMAAIRNHLTYISRNGKLELETDTGEHLTDKEGLTSFATELKTHIRGQPIPEVSKRREACNIILSMPAGTPQDAVREAAKEFLEEEFGGKHRYCFTLHTDTDKPHVHACVMAAPVRKGKRLNPRKADLQRWREGFAEQLRELGIDANATHRWARGATQKTTRQSAHHARKRQPIMFSRVMEPMVWPRIYQNAYIAWQRMANALQQSHRPSDQDMASQIESFINGPKPTVHKKR
ncbi:MAG: relaxase/mobilization nuclease domain-containing protein [Fluviibacter sp.]